MEWSVAGATGKYRTPISQGPRFGFRVWGSWCSDCFSSEMMHDASDPKPYKVTLKTLSAGTLEPLQPRSLEPEPQTLNPKPQTLNPKP